MVDIDALRHGRRLRGFWRRQLLFFELLLAASRRPELHLTVLVASYPEYIQAMGSVERRVKRYGRYNDAYSVSWKKVSLWWQL